MQRVERIYVLTIFMLIWGAFLFQGGQPLAAASLSQAVGDPVFVGAGDIADCNEPYDSATADLLDVITGTVFVLGDNAYERGALDEYINCYAPTWGRHKARTKPVPGNHEYGTTGAAGYYTYFGAAGSPLETHCTSHCKGYYSYDLGAWHIIALNSEIDHEPTSDQLAWLQADLAAHTNTCTLAYWHKPYYTSGQHTTDAENASFKSFWDLLYAYGADVVLNGHDHNYERFAPQNAAGQADPARGMREFVVGTGGRSLRELATVLPNSEVRNGDTHGVLKLTLHATSYDWQFIPIAGQTFTDTGTTNCVTATKTIPAPVGYWRMDPLFLEGTRITNTVTGAIDGLYVADAAPDVAPPDNNVGWAGATAKNKVTAKFDGTSDHIQIDSSAAFNLNTAMTLAAWVKLANPALEQKVVGKFSLGAARSGYVLGVKNGQLLAEVYDISDQPFVASGGTIAANTWTHIAVTWQTGGQFIAYINGVQVAERTASLQPIGGGPGAFLEYVIIGAAPWSPIMFNVNGNLDEVLIFNQALTSADIAQIAQRTFIVNSTANNVTTCDRDACSLKTAIELASAAPNGALRDRIHFDLPAPALIQPDAELPLITDAVIIDGLSQPGASCAAWPPTLKVTLDGSNAGVAKGLDIRSDNVMVRGLNVRNFAERGIRIQDANDGLIECNLLGTDLAGVAAAPNKGGIALISLTSPTLRHQVMRNLIAGNLNEGILIQGSHQNSVVRNYIGTSVNETTPLANGTNGISLLEAHDNTIGGQDSGNVIAYNLGQGIWITGTTSTGNQITENSIHSHAGLGIDLGASGVATNDAGDGDSGPNNLQNYPLLTQAVVTSASLAVTGTLNSTPNTPFLIEFFSNNAADADGSCEGATFVGFTVVTTDANGDAAITTTLTPHAIGGQLSATATNQTTYDTSEFSACRSVTGVLSLVSLAPLQRTVNEGAGNAMLTIQLSVAATLPITVHYSTSIIPVPGPTDATPGNDYGAATNQTVVVPANHITATLAIPIVDDAFVEQSERFTVTITLPANSSAVIDSSKTKSVITIVDNDATNTVPIANAQTVNVLQGTAKSITLRSSDAENDALSYAIVSPPTNGTLSGSAPNLTYTPNAGFVGADSFIFKVNDGQVDSAPATVTINITLTSPSNTVPIADAQTVNAVTGTAKPISLTGSDADSDALRYVVVIQPINGVLSGTAPNLIYTPNTGFVGNDSFTFKVNDGQVDSPTVTVTIVVAATTPVEGNNKIYLPLTLR